MNKSAVITAPADTRVPAVAPDDTAEAWTLLDKLAAIADRATKGDGLPAEMAEKLDALARSAREHGPVIQHPAWCARGDACHSDMQWEPDVVSVYHEATLFEMPADGGWVAARPGDRYQVHLMLAENYRPDGTVERDAVRLYVETPWQGGDGLHGAQLEKFTAALALAGQLAAMSPESTPTHPDVAGCDCCTSWEVTDPSIRITRGPTPD
jgi:hypothetical protein